MGYEDTTATEPDPFAADAAPQPTPTAEPTSADSSDSATTVSSSTAGAQTGETWDQSTNQSYESVNMTTDEKYFYDNYYSQVAQDGPIHEEDLQTIMTSDNATDIVNSVQDLSYMHDINDQAIWGPPALSDSNNLYNPQSGEPYTLQGDVVAISELSALQAALGRAEDLAASQGDLAAYNSADAAASSIKLDEEVIAANAEMGIQADPTGFAGNNKMGAIYEVAAAESGGDPTAFDSETGESYIQRVADGADDGLAFQDTPDVPDDGIGGDYAGGWSTDPSSGWSGI
jgi:hypothetical protein